MKTLIVYASRYNFTKDCVIMLQDKIKGDCDIVDIKNDKNYQLDSYDQLLIGGSIKMGSLQKQVKNFCVKNLSTLLNKKVGLFLSCGDVTKFDQYLADLLPSKLVDHAIDKQCFGGEFRTSQMGFIEKKMIENIIKGESEKGKALSIPLFENIDKLASAMNK